MSGLFKVPIFGATMTTGVQYDIWGITNHATRPTILKGMKLFQVSEFGDAQEEIIALQLATGHGTIGSGGAVGAITPINTDRGGSAAGFTARGMDTTKATGGTKVAVDPIEWNIRAGSDIILPEEWQIIIPAAVLWTIEMLTNPAGTKTIYGSLLVQEIG